MDKDTPAAGAAARFNVNAPAFIGTVSSPASIEGGFDFSKFRSAVETQPEHSTGNTSALVGSVLGNIVDGAAADDEASSATPVRE